MHIGHVIRILRIQRGQTQEELALEAQVATSNVSRIENGRRQPSQDLLQRLALALNTSVSRIHAMSEDGLFDTNDDLMPDRALPLPDMNLSGLVSEDRSPEDPLTPEVRALLKYFHQLTPENKTLAIEHIKLLNRLQKDP